MACRGRSSCSNTGLATVACRGSSSCSNTSLTSVACRGSSSSNTGLAVVACRGSSSNSSDGLAAVGFLISINVAPIFSLRPGRRDSSNRYSNRHGESLRSEGDGSSPLSETFFGGDGGAVEEWLQSGNMDMPMFSLSEGPQQSAPTAVALAATAPPAEAVTGTSVFPAVSSKGVAKTPTSSMGVASVAVPAVAPSSGGIVFPTASVGGAARAPSFADETAALTAAPSTGDTAASDASVERATRQLTLEESSAGTASTHAAAEAAPLTGDTAAPDASVERVARKLTLEAGPSSEICGERGASTHPFDPGTVFPVEVRYYKGSWLQHGSSNSSKSNSSSSSSSNSNDNTSSHDSWWDATCVGALLRPFDPRKRRRRSARIGKAIFGLDLPFDRGKAWRRMQHGG